MLCVFRVYYNAYNEDDYYERMVFIMNKIKAFVVMVMIVAIGMVNCMEADAACTTIYRNNNCVYSDKEPHTYTYIIFDSYGYRSELTWTIETLDLSEEEQIDKLSELYEWIRNIAHDIRDDVCDGNGDDRIYMIDYCDGVMHRLSTESKQEAYDECCEALEDYDKAVSEMNNN